MTNVADSRVQPRKRACPKCGGAMIVQRDVTPRDFEEATTTHVWKCLACGKEASIAMAEQPQPATTYRINPSWKTPAPQPPATAVAVIDPLSEAPAWTDSAIQRLTGLIAAVAQADALKAEAERTHAALTAYGVTNLPAVPWKRPPLAGNDRSAPTKGKLLPLPTSCARCGEVFVRRDEWRYIRGTETGACRDRVDCALRAQRAQLLRERPGEGGGPA